MSDMKCQKCGMRFETGKAYGYSCPHRPNCGPMITSDMAVPWGGFGATPVVQPDAAAIREAARLLDDIVCGRGMLGLDPAQDLQWATEAAAAALALIDKPAAPHVNETPKSEHDARDVLTPATKGGA